MRCFIVTKASPNRFRVPPVIARYGWQPTYLCDTDEQRKRLMGMFSVPAKCIVRTDVDKDAGIQGVALARHYAAQHVMPRDQWAIWIDDNVGQVTCLPHKLSVDFLDPKAHDINWRKAFEQEASPSDLDWHINQTIGRAEQQDTIFAGFAIETNWMFRLGKWQQRGYCRTQLGLYKNDGSGWMPFPTLMLEDLYKSIDVVARYGSIVINRHVKPIKPFFEAGGIGSFHERLPWLRDNCAQLMQMYPGLMKPVKGRDYHLTFAKRSQSTLDQWRRDHDYL